MKPIKDNANYMLSILKNYYELKKKILLKERPEQHGRGGAERVQPLTSKKIVSKCLLAKVTDNLWRPWDSFLLKLLSYSSGGQEGRIASKLLIQTFKVGDKCKLLLKHCLDIVDKYPIH